MEEKTNLSKSDIFSPYINTKLYTNVILYPNQMNNDIYKNLKDNLIKSIENKCFIDYGYIMKVYELLDYENGCIKAENTSASCTYDVIFSCRLCRPIKNKIIICEVERVNKVLIRLVNGPMFVIITNDRINDKEFFRDSYRNIRYKKDNSTIILNKGDFVKVSIIQYTFNNGDDNIVAIGYLESIANDENIKQYYKDEYSDKNVIESYSNFVKEEK